MRYWLPLASLLLTAGLPIAQARVINTPNARTPVARSSSSQSSRATARPVKRLFRTTPVVRSSHASSSLDTVDDAQRTKLESLRNNLGDVLKLMQKSANNDGYGDIFGRKNADVVRLQEIPDEYARIVQTMSVYAERAASKEPLPDYVKSDIQLQLAHANALEAEYREILKRFQCALQNNC